MTPLTLDDLDRRLLAELQADARITQVALGARLGISRSAVQERIKRLERAGVILGYSVRLGTGKTPGVRAYLLIKGGASHDRAAKAVAMFPEVKVVDSVSGEIDMVLQIESDRLEDVNRIRDEVAKMAGIHATMTLLVMAARLDRR